MLHPSEDAAHVTARRWWPTGHPPLWITADTAQKARDRLSVISRPSPWAQPIGTALQVE